MSETVMRTTVREVWKDGRLERILVPVYGKSLFEEEEDETKAGRGTSSRRPKSGRQSFPCGGFVLPTPAQMKGIVGGLQEAAVRINPRSPTGDGSGGCSSVPHLLSSGDYITRDGTLEITDEAGHVFRGKEVTREILLGWDIESDRRQPGERLVNKIIYSVKTLDGHPKEDFEEAVKKTCAEEFAGHRYAIAFHYDTDHPHAHVLCTALNRETQRKLHKNIAGLQKMRENFVSHLREAGIEANATRRYQRQSAAPRMSAPELAQKEKTKLYTEAANGILNRISKELTKPPETRIPVTPDEKIRRLVKTNAPARRIIIGKLDAGIQAAADGRPELAKALSEYKAALPPARPRGPGKSSEDGKPEKGRKNLSDRLFDEALETVKKGADIPVHESLRRSQNTRSLLKRFAKEQYENALRNPALTQEELNFFKAIDDYYAKIPELVKNRAHEISFRIGCILDTPGMRNCASELLDDPGRLKRCTELANSLFDKSVETFLHPKDGVSLENIPELRFSPRNEQLAIEYLDQARDYYFSRHGQFGSIEAFSKVQNQIRRDSPFKKPHERIPSDEEHVRTFFERKIAEMPGMAALKNDPERLKHCAEIAIRLYACTESAIFHPEKTPSLAGIPELQTSREDAMFAMRCLESSKRTASADPWDRKVGQALDAVMTQIARTSPFREVRSMAPEYQRPAYGREMCR